MARTILCEENLSKYFWIEAINTACYILNYVLIRLIPKKIPYVLWRGRKSNISYFHIFGCRCFILNNEKNNLEKCDTKSDENEALFQVAEFTLEIAEIIGYMELVGIGIRRVGLLHALDGSRADLEVLLHSLISSCRHCPA